MVGIGNFCHRRTVRTVSKCNGFVAFEGFVLYAGGDYALYPNIMLLVQVMAYVMSGTFAADKVRHWTCAPESGPLIGSPVRTILQALGSQSSRRVS